MNKHIVCLSFDFDAMSIWIARDMTTPQPLSRGEFGLVGARRILDLLRRYDIRATWFIPGHTIETFPWAAEEVFANGHEIGNHGWTHRSPLGLEPKEEERELLRASASIEALIGRRPVGYRSPIWDTTPYTIPLLLQNGFRYVSNGMAQDYTPYRARCGDVVTMHEPAVLGPETPLIDIPVSWSLDDAPHFEVVRTPNWIQPGLSNANDVLANWTADFDYMRRVTEWGTLTYTFHPYCIGRGHRMLLLERLVEHLVRNDAVFMTMAEVAEEFDRRSPFREPSPKEAVN